MVYKINFSILFLGLIAVIAFIIRLYNLSQIPTGFFADEASIGHNAYTLFSLGQDEYGNRFPLLFESFGGTFFRPGVSIYIVTLFIKIFGLSEFSVRLASATIGTLTIILIFLLVKTLYQKDMIALFSAFSLAISPWHIHFSRIGQEFVYLVFFLTLGVYLFVASIKKRNTMLLLSSFFVFGLSLYTYVPAYFLLPLFLLALCMIYKDSLITNKRAMFFGILIFSALLLPLLLGILSGKTMSRFTQLRPTYETKSHAEILTAMLRSYRDHFMPEFLFEKGDIGYRSHFITRFSVGGMGQLYWFQLPLLLVGFLSARKNKKALLILMLWLALYPLGSALVPFADGGGPFAMHSIIGVIPFQILSALGVYTLIAYFNQFQSYIMKIGSIMILSIIVLLSFNSYLNNYFIKYPLYSSNFWGWQYGPGEIIAYFKEQRGKYDDLYLASKFNAPEIFIKFYDPENICSGKCRVGDIDRFDPKRKQLFAIAAGSLSSAKLFTIDIKKTIFYPNCYPAFYIAVIKK